MTENMKLAIYAINKWMYLGWNYKSVEYSRPISGGRSEIIVVPDFLIGVKWTCTTDHMINKWRACCHQTGPYGYLSKFYAELDAENSRRLITWVMENYNGEKSI